jgi:hypothetical protein
MTFKIPAAELLPSPLSRPHPTGKQLITVIMNTCLASCRHIFRHANVEIAEQL